MMKKCILTMMAAGFCANLMAQKPTVTAAASPGNNAAPPAAKKDTGPKPYKEVITEKAVSKQGLFAVHRIEDKYYFEIPDSIMGREIMAVTRYIKVPANGGVGRSTYGGELSNQQTVSFQKGPSNNVFMRVITLVNTADTANAIFKAVSNSNLDAIAAAFPIAALGKDSSGVVIDVTDYFKGDNQVVSISPATKRAFSLTSIASDRSYIESIKTFPSNIEVRTVKTFNATAPQPGMPSITPVASVPAVQATGAVTIELNTSMILLPKVPMDIRYWDRRVGYFPDNFIEYSDGQQKAEDKTFAVRWRLEPKDEDVEKWKRGELVEPKKPIVYYIDPATPKQWVPYLIKGINDWQVAFEKAGFKNAIIGKEWPNDPDMSMEDARYSVLRYFASEVANAYGPNVHDPRSGEILESHIGWYHNVMTLVHNWYMVQAAAVDPKARKMKFDDSLMGELIRFVSSHEVGHTLGLLHNMGSSSRTPVENLRNKAWVEAHGHTASIMDYARFNYVAQPEDNIREIGLFPRIGDYDRWAIRWGYGYIPGMDEEEKRKASNKLVSETLAKDPYAYFGTYELGNSTDPRNQREDLGDDGIKASEYGVKNLKYIVANLQNWTKEDIDQYDNLTTMYNAAIGQLRLYIGHVTTIVGGVNETIQSSGSDEPVYEVVQKAKQKQAVTFLDKQIFTTPGWLINTVIYDRTVDPSSSSDPVASLQESALSSLVSSSRINRLQVSVDRFGADKAYSGLDMLSDVQASLFSELKANKAIDTYRRSLQKSYVAKLDGMLNAPANILMISGGRIAANPFDISRSDVPSIVRAQLTSLKAIVAAAIPNTSDKISKLHLIDLQERIKKALDPKQ